VLRVDVEARPDQRPAGTLTHELEREYRAVGDEINQPMQDTRRATAQAPGNSGQCATALLAFAATAGL